MKKLLFCLQTMVFGGVETELITILKRFDLTKYDITLLIFYEDDPKMLKKIPGGIRVINLGIDKNYYCSGFSTLIKERLKRGELFPAAGLIFSRIFCGMPAPVTIDIGKIPSPEGEYDVAICYHMHSPLVLRYVADKVKAKKKIAWIHNDFSTTGYKIEKYEKCLGSYDSFAAVSKRLYEEFVSRLPCLAEKSEVANNIVDDAHIEKRAKETDTLDERFTCTAGVRLLTVGRFVEQKGFDIAIDATKILKGRGIDLTWFAIGYGPEEENLSKRISEFGLSESFILLGRKENPYPYMAAADLYVQPSRHEGYPITLCEAKALKKVTLCTNFAGAEELVRNGIDGIITEGFDAKSIADEIEKLLLDKDKLNSLRENVGTATSVDAFQKIESFFNEE